jgi:hypothetical protein
MEETKTLKQQLLTQCIAIQENNVKTAHEAMLASQESANEQKGTMGDKYESFREQMQIDRDMYARQYDEGMQVMKDLNKIDPEAMQAAAALGAVVITDKQKFFVSASLGQIVIGNETYMAISTHSPLFKAMAGKKSGEAFSFRDKSYSVQQVL